MANQALAEVDAAEAKKQRKAAKRAAAEAAAAEPVEELELDPAEAKRQRKAAKKAAAEAAEAAAAEEPEEDEAEAKRKRKAAKKAAKEAAAVAEAAAAEEPEVDEAEAKRQRKAAKKANAAAAAAEEPTKTAKRAASEAKEADDAEDEAPKKKSKKEADQDAPLAEGKGKGGGKGNKSFEVFVGGLPFDTQEEVLRKDFTECGQIIALRMPLNDEGNARGIAFIEYQDNESVEKALAFNDTEYGGRWLAVRRSGDSSGKDGKGKGKDKGKDKGKAGGNKEFEVFIGGIPWSSTEGSLRKDFGECGEIVKLGMPLNDEGNAKGIAFIQYTNKESCEKALKFHDTEYGGRWLTLRMSSDPPPAKGAGKDKAKGGKGNKELEVFVAGLPWSTTEESLKEKFAEFGEIVMCRIPLNDEGKPKGIAFIEYKDKDACEKALSLNDTEMGDRTLAVKMAGDGGKGKGKDGKGKGKKGKGEKNGGLSAETRNARDGAMGVPQGKKQTFEDSDGD